MVELSASEEKKEATIRHILLPYDGVRGIRIRDAGPAETRCWRTRGVGSERCSRRLLSRESPAEDFRVGLTFLLAVILLYLGRASRELAESQLEEHQGRCTSRQGGGERVSERSLNCVLSAGTRFILAIAPGSAQWKLKP